MNAHSFCKSYLSIVKADAKKHHITIGKLSVTGEPKTFFVQEQMEDDSWSIPKEVEADCISMAKAEYISKRFQKHFLNKKENQNEHIRVVA
jgi:hypothetical protein